MIRNWQPWKLSTGARTEGGKERSKMNALKHGCFLAEEKSYLENYKHPMIQLDPMKVMLVMSHSENTFDKTKMREVESPVVKKTTMKLNQFIKDRALREFFKNA